jgi:hypothetical protein
MSLHFDIPPGLQPEAQIEMKRWHAEQQQLLKELLKEPLRILVWGPGKVTPGNKGQERKEVVVNKRIQIRDALINAGHAATFSEHWPSQQHDVSLKMWEYTQARTSHLIILLIEESPGGQGELHDFSLYEEVVAKLFVMFPVRYKNSYTALAIGNLLSNAFHNVYWYQDGDIEDCHVLSAAMNKASATREVVALRKLMEKRV